MVGYRHAMIEIHCGANLPILRSMEACCFDLIYVDPPFNPGHAQVRTSLRTERVEDPGAGDRTGFGGKRYRTMTLGSQSFADAFDDFMGFLGPRLVEARRLLR